VPKEFEAQKTQNPDELPEIERSTGHEQIHGVADLAFRGSSWSSRSGHRKLRWWPDFLGCIVDNLGVISTRKMHFALHYWLFKIRYFW